MSRPTPALTVDALQRMPLSLHRLDPSRPLRDAHAATAFVRERGIVVESARCSLPSLTEAIAGRHLRGSWMADREVYRIHRIMGAVRKQGVFGAPLIDGKETLLGRGWTRPSRVAVPAGRGPKVPPARRNAGNFDILMHNKYALMYEDDDST